MIEVYYLKSQTFKICRIALIAIFFGLWCWLKILTQVPLCMVPNGGNPPKVVSSWSTKSNNSYGLLVNLVTLCTMKNDPTYTHRHILQPNLMQKKTLLSLWLWHDCFPKKRPHPSCGSTWASQRHWALFWCPRLQVEWAHFATSGGELY